MQRKGDLEHTYYLMGESKLLCPGMRKLFLHPDGDYKGIHITGTHEAIYMCGLTYSCFIFIIKGGNIYFFVDCELC